MAWEIHSGHQKDHLHEKDCVAVAQVIQRGGRTALLSDFQELAQ